MHPKLADWCCVWGKPNCEWNMIIYFRRLQLRLRACSWILMNPDDTKVWAKKKHNCTILIRKYKSPQRKHARSSQTLPNKPFSLYESFQTLLSAHKGIQNHSLQFQAEAIHQKNETMDWAFQIFTLGLGEVTSCLRVESQWKTGMDQGKKEKKCLVRRIKSCQTVREKKKGPCVAYHEELHWWACDLFFFCSECTFSFLKANCSSCLSLWGKRYRCNRESRGCH